MISTLKVHTSETRTLIEKIEAEVKKRAETKARRMLLKVPKRPMKRSTATRTLVKITFLFEMSLPSLRSRWPAI
jgi:hypothetical protein